MAPKKKTSAEPKNYKTLEKGELSAELTLVRKELFSLSMKNSLGELKQPHLLRAARRNVAKISTALSQSI